MKVVQVPNAKKTKSQCRNVASNRLLHRIPLAFVEPSRDWYNVRMECPLLGHRWCSQQATISLYPRHVCIFRRLTIDEMKSVQPVPQHA